MNRQTIFLILLSLLIGGSTISAKSPWDMVIFDISSDMEVKDSNGKSEMAIANSCIDYLAEVIEPTDTVMVFAGGRTLIPFKQLIPDGNQSYSSIRNCIGDDTAIYNSILSTLNLPKPPQRILVITNGKDGISSFSSKTTWKILKSKGISVDGIQVTINADSIFLDDDNIFPYLKPSDNFEQMVKKSGGQFVSLTESDNVAPELALLVKKSGKAKPVKKQNHGYDKQLLNKFLTGLSTHKIEIREVDTTATFIYNNIEFHGLNDIINHINGTNNIYIGSDTQRYPCFDSYDALYEDRKYQNYYFADSQQQLDDRKALMTDVDPQSNYCKLHQNTPIDVLPMIYYRGEGDKMTICGLPVIIKYDEVESDEDEDADEVEVVEEVEEDDYEVDADDSDDEIGTTYEI